MHMFRTNASQRMPVGTRAKVAAAFGCLVLAAGVGSALAYLTDVDSAANRFSVAPALTIDLVEEKWDGHPDTDGDGVPDPAEEIVPSQTIAKDPAVENTTGTQAWVFLEISVPTHVVSTVAADGSIADPALTELFSYATNSGWVEMGTATYDAEHDTTVHRYAWDGPLDTGARTGTLFDSVTFANLADNQLDALAAGGIVSLVIDVEALGIQTEGFDTWQDAWDALVSQTGRA